MISHDFLYKNESHMRELMSEMPKPREMHKSRWNMLLNQNIFNRLKLKIPLIQKISNSNIFLSAWVGSKLQSKDLSYPGSCRPEEHSPLCFWLRSKVSSRVWRWCWWMTRQEAGQLPDGGQCCQPCQWGWCRCPYSSPGALSSPPPQLSLPGAGGSARARQNSIWNKFRWINLVLGWLS